MVFSDDNGITVQFDSDSSVSGYTSSWTVACVDDSAVMGCMDSTALNYNADATMDDGSCTYPLSTTVTLPFDFDGTNCGSGNDVNSTTLGYTEYYAGGEDAVFDFVGTGTAVDITLTASETYTGFLVFEGNPNEGGAMVFDGGTSGAGASGTVETTDGTTYYVVVDSWPSPNCWCLYSFYGCVLLLEVVLMQMLIIIMLMQLSMMVLVLIHVH